MNILRTAVLCLIGCTYGAGNARALEWKPIDPADLKADTPHVEKDADAEALFWDVRVLNEVVTGVPRSVMIHYLRVKIYTEHGRELYGAVNIQYRNKHYIVDVAGRTIKPDGSILELDKNSIHDQIQVKAGGVKVRTRAFAMPGVAPGVIIEYRWKEISDDEFSHYLRLPFQRDIPVRSVTYHIKPYSDSSFPYSMRTMSFNLKAEPFQREADGYYAMGMQNMPALHEEPRMPPEAQVSSWMLIYYSQDYKLEPDRYWKQLGRLEYAKYKPFIKTTGDIKTAAAEAVSDVKTDEEKVHALFNYVRSHIKNTGNEEGTAEERADALKNKTPNDALKKGLGNSREINMVFAALATAAGLDARIALVSDRGDYFFDKSFPDGYFLTSYDVAIRVGGKWQFYDPGSRWIPFGMLRWQEELQSALVTDSKDPEFVMTQLTPTSQSESRHTGKFTLDESGTLQGDVDLLYTGHPAISFREASSHQSDAEQEEEVKNTIKRRMSTAEVTDVKIMNLKDVEKPLLVHYHVSVPGYAQRTGKHLFIQPAFFRVGFESPFASATRRYGIYFHYPWEDEDNVEIELPEGYELDHADAPSPVQIAEVGNFDVSLKVKGGRDLVYHRKLEFGTGGRLVFPVTGYPPLKKLFDYFYQADNHSIPLKKATGKDGDDD